MSEETKEDESKNTNIKSDIQKDASTEVTQNNNNSNNNNNNGSSNSINRSPSQGRIPEATSGRETSPPPHSSSDHEGVLPSSDRQKAEAPAHGKTSQTGNQGVLNNKHNVETPSSASSTEHEEHDTSFQGAEVGAEDDHHRHHNRNHKHYHQHRLKDQFGRNSLGIDTRLVPMLGQFVASIILMVSLISLKSEEEVVYFEYGITVAVVSIVFNIVGMVIILRDMEKTIFSMHERDLTVLSVNNIFLFLWWVAGVGILTFVGPFNVISNGYFACWAGFYYATIGITSSQFVQDHTRRKEGIRNFLLVASIVLICALPIYIAKGTIVGGEDVEGDYTIEAIYALVIACLTAVIILFAKFSSSTVLRMKGSSLWKVIAVAWLVSACLTTFRGPYVLIGNGYIASWVGLYLSTIEAGYLREVHEETTAEEEIPKEEV